MKLNHIILDRCIHCGSAENLSAYLYEYGGHFAAEFLAFCTRDFCQESATDIAYTKMTIEEAKLFVVKAKL